MTDLRETQCRQRRLCIGVLRNTCVCGRRSILRVGDTVFVGDVLSNRGGYRSRLRQGESPRRIVVCGLSCNCGIRYDRSFIRACDVVRLGLGFEGSGHVRRRNVHEINRQRPPGRKSPYAWCQQAADQDPLNQTQSIRRPAYEAGRHRSHNQHQAAQNRRVNQPTPKEIGCGHGYFPLLCLRCVLFLRFSAISFSSSSSSCASTFSRLTHAQHELIEGAVKHLVQESGRHILSRAMRRVDKRPPLAAMGDEPLRVHDPHLRLDRVEMQSGNRGQLLVDVAHGTLPQFPKGFEDFHFSIGGRGVH